MDISSAVVTISLAALSGLCYVAVKHPKTFNSLWGKLYGAAVVIAAMLSAWSFGVNAAQARLIKLVPPQKASDAAGEIASIYINPLAVMIGMFCVCGFLLFLSWLSNSIHRERSEPDSG